MRKRKVLIPVLIIIHLIMTACVYIVLPEGLDTTSSIVSKGWSGVVTGISQTEEGSLHIDLTIRNETGDWSTMSAVEDKPAILPPAMGKSMNARPYLSVRVDIAWHLVFKCAATRQGRNWNRLFN